MSASLLADLGESLGASEDRLFVMWICPHDLSVTKKATEW
jgi:hypothetical protein